MDIRRAFQLMFGKNVFFKVDRNAGKSGQLPVPSELATPPPLPDDVPLKHAPSIEHELTFLRVSRFMKIFQETEEMLGSTELTTQGERWKNGVTQHHWPQGARLLDNSIQPFDVQI